MEKKIIIIIVIVVVVLLILSVLIWGYATGWTFFGSSRAVNQQTPNVSPNTSPNTLPNTSPIPGANGAGIAPIPSPTPTASYPMNTPVQFKIHDATGKLLGIGAMWGKPRVAGQMGNKTPFKMYTGDYGTCALTNCAFKMGKNTDGSVSILAADGSGIMAAWDKFVGVNANGHELFMYDNSGGPCMTDGCSFSIKPDGNYFVISAFDGTGYIAVRGLDNASQFYMDSDMNKAVRFEFASIP